MARVAPINPSRVGPPSADADMQHVSVGARVDDAPVTPFSPTSQKAVLQEVTPLSQEEIEAVAPTPARLL